jgi:uncharacterized protein DUF4038/uncharacterized protein DUF5060/zinc carboxypeptidase/collagenase-like protein with putative collagen-binding domain
MSLSRRAFLGTAAVPAGAQASDLEIVVPEDGGTPRDPARIVRQGAREFHITASVEEGKSPLTHAVSRVDVIVRNPGPPAEVTLHFELSGGGTRPNFDTSHFGGMPKRDFIYVKQPGKPWQRVDGTTKGWVATMRFTVPTGDTQVGLGPWYTYADYLAFVQSLAPSPYLKKEKIGTSDGGREHWELTITDPSVPAENKRRILWHAREHAYETFSSFAIEGAIEYLQSPAAAEARRHFVFILHPMTNVDGVALGYEYRGGYDFPEPRGTATARLTFAAADRLRPHYFIAWHNWTAPRDVSVVFYTDSQDGKPGRRIWDLLTQHMPSPRATGHRWDSETRPQQHNYFGRKLTETNVHQYAMLRYGTGVFGWEMPWYGRDEGDPTANSRQLGRHYARSLIAAIESQWTPPQDAAPIDAVRWQMHEFTLRGRANVDNPFKDTTLVGEFTSPSGKTIIVEGFHDGGDTWRLRLAPPETGDWRYLLRGEGVSLYQRGVLRVKPATGHGFIGIHPQNPYAFAYADGTPFFPMGDTCYGLFDDSPITPALRAEYLESRRRQRFNFVRISIGHSPYRAAAEAAYWAWGGTEQNPDLDRLNPIFFQGFDRMLRDMRERGMNAELLLFNYYRKPFTDPAQWTASRERLWLRNVIARYGALDNVFLWTLSNEYETHPDGKYRLDFPDDVEWAKRIGRTVKDLDAHGHPYSVHPVVSSSTKGSSPRDPFEPPWRIGGFYGDAPEVDVLSQQTSTPYAGTWDDKLQCWTGDAAGVERSLAADRVFRKPVLNTENGYEYLSGYATNKSQVHHTDKVRRASWRIVCAGGYLSAGFISTIGHSDNWDRIDPASKHPFFVKDSGAAGQLALLYDFFQSLPYWRMEPLQEYVRGDALCFAARGEVYAIYLPHGGEILVSLELSDKLQTARWFNPRSGAFQPAASSGSGPWRSFIAPDREDWTLLVSRA